MNDDLESVDGEDDPHPSADFRRHSNNRPRNIDLIDLQFRPNEDDSLRIVNLRKTQKLISADIRWTKKIAIRILLECSVMCFES